MKLIYLAASLMHVITLTNSLPMESLSLLTFSVNIEENDIASVIKKGVRHLGHVHFADSNRRPIGNRLL